LEFRIARNILCSDKENITGGVNLDVEIKLDPNFKTPKLVIYTSEITDHISELVRQLSNDSSKLILGSKNGEIFLINPNDEGLFGSAPVFNLKVCGGDRKGKAHQFYHNFGCLFSISDLPRMGGVKTIIHDCFCSNLYWNLSNNLVGSILCPQKKNTKFEYQFKGTINNRQL
jgi:hypothetical protein